MFIFLSNYFKRLNHLFNFISSVRRLNARAVVINSISAGATETNCLRVKVELNGGKLEESNTNIHT